MSSNSPLPSVPTSPNDRRDLKRPLVRTDRSVDTSRMKAAHGVKRAKRAENLAVQLLQRPSGEAGVEKVWMHVVRSVCTGMVKKHLLVEEHFVAVQGTDNSGRTIAEFVLLPSNWGNFEKMLLECGSEIIDGSWRTDKQVWEQPETAGKMGEQVQGPLSVLLPPSFGECGPKGVRLGCVLRHVGKPIMSLGGNENVDGPHFDKIRNIPVNKTFPSFADLLQERFGSTGKVHCIYVGGVKLFGGVVWKYGDEDEETEEAGEDATYPEEDREKAGVV